MGNKITTPIALSRTRECTITPRWFVDKSEYNPLTGTFQLLTNGEMAFREVYQAIAAAKKSVSIICWGFQPSMYFVRDGASETIGELLEKVGRKGVKVRVLSFVVDPLWLGIGVTGRLPGEANTPGRRWAALKDRPPTSTDAQHRYDREWYLRYDEDQKIADALGKETLNKLDGKPRTGNIRFVGRGFSAGDRYRIAKTDYADPGVSTKTKGALAAGPSHHQKMVLVDHEDPEKHVGFVMGHNMLDEYWDTDNHTARRHYILNHGRPDPHPNRGPNGTHPRQDFSSRITGPVVGDLFANFNQAWQKETGETLPAPDFSKYPVADTRQACAMAQILRTQPQHGRRDIKACYLQAVNNATQYIYFENQYFRWPPLAEKIKACAAGQTAWGRKPETHGPLYLFVITNADKEGMGAGVRNTYRMLESLGRADTLPEVTRQERAEDVKARLGQARRETAAAKREIANLDSIARQIQGLGGRASADLTRRYEAANARLKDAQAREKSLQQEQEKLQDREYVVQPEERPGLKTHICTLVAPDTKEKEAWVDVYIHAKLTLIDDAFMTLGSANINTRSMEVDSELNIAHHRPEITGPARRTLWGMHTGGASGEEAMNAAGMDTAYDSWRDIMDKNKPLRPKNKPPIAPLCEFYSSTTDRTDND